MAKKIINIGKSQNKGDGDPLRTAFSKVNDNFDELYSGTFTDTTDFTTSIIPRTDNEISLGSSTKRWSELYVKDFIFINGVRLSGSASGDLVVGGNIVQAKDIVGSIFADDSTLMMDGLTGKHYGPLIGDVTGSVFADNSTLLIDGVAGNIPSANISGTEATNWNAAFAWGNHASVGYQIAGAPHDGDVTGSVFADDSSMLVDGVAGKLILNNNTTAELPEQGNLYFTDARADARVNSIVTQAFVNTLNVTASSTVGTVTGTLDGDVTGSVFGDDSTVLVDGVNNKIFGAVDATSIRTSEDKIALGENTGVTNQAYGGIAIGNLTGTVDQGSQATAVGTSAGRERQGAQATALGRYAGQNDQGVSAVAIGHSAGRETQGTVAIAIGKLAGETNQAANSIVINATGSAVENTTASSLVIKPIRSGSGTTTLMYDASTGEVTHTATPAQQTMIGSVQQISGPGAIDVTSYITEITTTGTDAYTLADGVAGQIKIISMIVDGGDATITPTTLATGTTITMADVNDNVTLLYGTNGWVNTANQGAIIA